MSTDSVIARIDEITATANKRHSECSLLELHPFDCLTADEREELHELKMRLPAFAEEREAARARIQDRILSRRRGNRELLPAGELT